MKNLQTMISTRRSNPPTVGAVSTNSGAVPEALSRDIYCSSSFFIFGISAEERRLKGSVSLLLWSDNMARAFARRFYSSEIWQNCRNEYMKRVGGLCENCLRRGIYKPAVIVHHKIELDPTNIDNPEITLNFDNLEAVCRDCHAEYHPNDGKWGKVNEQRKKERAASQRYKIGENGEIFPNEPPSVLENHDGA